MSQQTDPGNDLDEATERLAAQFIALIGRGDTDGLAGCCTDDVVVWHNDDGLEVPISKVARTLGWLHRHAEDLRYEEVRRRAIAGGYVQQHVLRGKAPGGDLELPACLIVSVRDGRISRIDEYLDTGRLTGLWTPAEPQAAG